MKSICWFVLLTISLVCHADEKPPLEREGEKLPVVKMPLAKEPVPMNAHEAPLLEKAYPPNTDVAVEGRIRFADPKDFEPFTLIVRFTVKEKQKPGWETVEIHKGGQPVKVEEGLYRYRTVIRTPEKPGIYFVHVYNRDRTCMTMARIDVDEDIE
jgi:hypothetical protein